VDGCRKRRNDAVIVFLVLSGFVISYTVQTKERTAQTYFVNRLARLWSVAIHFPRTGPYVFPADKRTHKEAESFNGWSKGKRAFDKQLKIPHYVLHGFRRTLRTCWAELGILEEVAEKYINTFSASTTGYNAPITARNISNQCAKRS